MIDLTNPRSLPLKSKRHVFVDERTGAQVELNSTRDDPAEAAAGCITQLIEETDFNSMDSRYKNSINRFMHRMVRATGMGGPLAMMLDIMEQTSPPSEAIPDVPGILRVGPYVTWDMSIVGKNSQLMVNTMNGLVKAAGENATPELVAEVKYFSDELEEYIAECEQAEAKSKVSDPIEQMIRDMFPGAQIMNLGGFKL